MGRLYEELVERERKGQPIGLGLVGVGQMGVDMMAAVRSIPGVYIAAVADLTVERAVVGFKEAEYSEAEYIIEGQNASAEPRRKAIIVKDPLKVAELSCVEVVVDATGDPETGAHLAMNAIHNGKHVVMLNIEADVTVGPILNRMAQDAGVVYTGSAGDEPVAIIELIEFVKSVGLQVVAAGKGKNNPLDPDAVPSDLAEEAAGRGLNPRMLVEFVDGSKTMIEMGAVANATGLIPDVPGMHGPSINKDQLNTVLVPASDGGILHNQGVVDFVIGDLAPGVFVVAYTDSPRLRQCLKLRDMGPGPYYTFIRPYHLCSMETPLSAARAAIFGQADMAFGRTPTVEIIALAKKDLSPGETIDGIGGYTVRASVIKYEDAKSRNAVPLGLVKGLEVTKPIPKGSIITHEMVQPRSTSLIWNLRKIQDELFR